MSPRRVAVQRLGLTVSLLAVLLGGCIFSPKEKSVPDPGSGIIIPKSPAELITKLADVYQKRDYPGFANLFPTEADNADYLFILYKPAPTEPPNWDVTEELRIHQRMFEPESPRPGDTPVPTDLWLQGITITLSPIREFAEAPGYYATPENPAGLDSQKWHAFEAEYDTNVFFDTQIDVDYRVQGDAMFVVIEDLAKAVGDDRKFLLYRWEDLGCPTCPPKPASSAVPAL